MCVESGKISIKLNHNLSLKLQGRQDPDRDTVPHTVEKWIAT